MRLQFQTTGTEDDDRDSALGDADNGLSTASIASSILEYRTINGRTYHSERSVASDSGLYWSVTDSCLICMLNPVNFSRLT